MIQATLITFPGDAVPPGFVSGGHNSGAVVAVTSAATNLPITTAAVTVNGVALDYVSADQQYEAALDLNPGVTVQVKVVVNGATYTAARQNFSTYPTITAPATNATWSTEASNLISWTGTVPTATSEYAIAVLDTGGSLLWPPGSSMMIVSSATNSVTVGPGEVSVGSRLVLVGIVDVVDIAGASGNSGLVIGGFHYAPITVATPSAAPQSVAISPASVTVGVGRSKQLAATATLSDNRTQDVTTQATWTSSDPTKVTVSGSGQVTGVAGGQVTVTAQFGGFSASASVSVFVPNPTPTPTISQAVTYQIDVAHSGHASVGGSGPVFPPAAHWSTTLSGTSISYPVIAEGKVFVTTNATPPGETYGTTLYAIDEVSGAIAWGPTPISGLYSISGTAYDHGRLFVVNFDGLVRSFDAATGAPGWSTQPSMYSFTDSAPTAVNGILYVAGGNGLVAIDETNGNVMWTASAGDHSSPAVSADGVFVSNTCYALKLDPIVGTILWHFSEACGGGGGKTVTLANNAAYVRQLFDTTTSTMVNLQLDMATGRQTGTFNAEFIPAFSATTGFFMAYQDGVRTLSAIASASGSTQWTFQGDGHLVTAPIVVDGAVVVAATSGIVYALDARNGNVLWSDTAAGSIDGPDEQNAMILTGLGVGDGYLVVPAGNVLNGWRLIP